MNFQNKVFKIDFCDFPLQCTRMNCDEMAGDRLTVCEQELL